MRINDKGIVLLEALVALAILGSAAIALVTLAAMATRMEARDRADERWLGEADRVLSATSLLTRIELDQRLGNHDVGEFSVAVQRPERGLYRISISPIDARGAEQLVTVVSRPVREELP